MLSYSGILKKAYKLTVQNPVLWLFGLFIAGGFNLNFLQFHEFEFSLPQAELEFYRVLFLVQKNPEILALISISVLLGAIVSLLLTNFSKVLLVSTTNELLQEKFPPEWKKIFKESGRSLWPVIKVSLLTSTLMLSVAAVLLLPLVIIIENPLYQTLLLSLGGTIFVPLAFMISAMNIFTAYFIILQKVPMGKALNLCTDFIVSNWTKILGLAVLLMLIYIGVFAVGAGIILSFRWIIGQSVAISGNLNNLYFSGMISSAKLITWLLLWILIAGLNVFFNTAMLVLFMELVKPVKKAENPEEKLAPAVAEAL